MLMIAEQIHNAAITKPLKVKKCPKGYHADALTAKGHEQCIICGSIKRKDKQA